jgi:hypothetical protein
MLEGITDGTAPVVAHSKGPNIRGRAHTCYFQSPSSALFVSLRPVLVDHMQ